VVGKCRKSNTSVQTGPGSLCESAERPGVDYESSREPSGNGASFSLIITHEYAMCCETELQMNVTDWARCRVHRFMIYSQRLG